MLKILTWILTILTFFIVPNHHISAVEEENEWNRSLERWSFMEFHAYWRSLRANEWSDGNLSNRVGWTSNLLKLDLLRCEAFGNEDSPQEAKEQIDRIINECGPGMLISLRNSCSKGYPLANDASWEIIRERCTQKDYFRWEYLKSIRPLDLKDFRHILNQLHKENNQIRSKVQIQGILRMIANKDDYENHAKLLHNLIKKIIMDAGLIPKLIERTTKNETVYIGMMLANYYSNDLKSEAFPSLCFNLTPKKKRVVQMIRLERIRHDFLKCSQFEVQSLLYTLKKEGWRDLIWNEGTKKRKMIVSKKENSKIVEETSETLRRSKRLQKG